MERLIIKFLFMVIYITCGIENVSEVFFLYGTEKKVFDPFGIKALDHFE